MKPRYNERVPVKAPVIFNVGALNGEGHVLDLTIPGCLIESPTAVKRGDYVQLIIALPRLKSTISVPLAAIRWTNGGQFGVEFIKMSE